MNEENRTYELVNFCEFDKHAAQSYCAIHNVDESLNLGDILEVDETKLKDFNMMTWGFPCQNISIAGNKNGLQVKCNYCNEVFPMTQLDNNKCPFCNSSDIKAKSKSGMYYEGLRILKEKKPALSIIENVKNLTSKSFKDVFATILSDLDSCGYNTYWKVLNACNYGVPQNRERVILVSVRNDLDNGLFDFPKGFKLTKTMSDIKEQSDLSYAYLTEKQKTFILDMKNTQINTKWEGRTDNGLLNPTIAKTLQTKGKARQRAHMNTFFVDGLPDNITVKEYKEKYMNTNPNIRYATSLERFRLMGFDDKDYYALINIGMSENQMNIFTGNSIVVDVLYYIYVELYKAMPYLFDDLKLSSFFSGIGAFEKALDRLYNDIT